MSGLADPIRCEVCCGRKTLLGIGNMTVDCYECLGVGYVMPKVEVAGKLDEPVVSIVKVRKKRGPNKKTGSKPRAHMEDCFIRP